MFVPQGSSHPCNSTDASCEVSDYNTEHRSEESFCFLHIVFLLEVSKVLDWQKVFIIGIKSLPPPFWKTCCFRKMQQNLAWCQKDQGVRSIAQKWGNYGFALTTPRVMFDSTRYIYSISILIVPGHSLSYILCSIGLLCCLWHWKSCFPQYASWLSAWLLFLTLSWLVSCSHWCIPYPHSTPNAC